MPVTGSLLKIITRYTWLGQRCQNVAWYQPVGVVFATADMTAVCEAYWNTIKNDIRPIAPNNLATASFDSILGYEYDGGLGYAEYPVPTGERAGTRGPGAPEDAVSGALDVGARLTVGTRMTRPGHKRIPFLFQIDVEGNAVAAPFLALAEPVFKIWSEPVNLLAPLLLGVLNPMVVSLDSFGVVSASQPVTGQVINPDLTTQVSRKKGRGI